MTEEEPKSSISFPNNFFSSSFSFSNTSIYIKTINNHNTTTTTNNSVFSSNNYTSINDNYSIGEGVIVIIGMLLLLIILMFILYKWKPWRYFSVSRIFKADELKRPLVSEDPCNDFTRFCRVSENASKQNDNYVVEIPDNSEETSINQTLKRIHVPTVQSTEEEKEETIFTLNTDINLQRGSILKLEIISGPCNGNSYSIKSTNTSLLPLTFGRLAPNDIVIGDLEVSAKHALINWNKDKLKWELMDVGSLNGTYLNQKPINYPGKRCFGDSFELSNGDIITLGSTSKISVQIVSTIDTELPCRVGVASDPMALRRGGRKLPMEDVYYYKWPLPGTNQFGVFGICDGHGGANAAISVSKIMPEMITKLLSDSYKREEVLIRCNASDVLGEAFFKTEALIDHEYEGCTATVLLIWLDSSHKNIYAQCANVGDSACFIDIDGKEINMTEDHRVTSYSERVRIQATGKPLRDGEKRLYGLNLARVLGDKFLKEQDTRFSSEPYISEVVCIGQTSKAFALLASDGLWDVINVKKAAQLVKQMKDCDDESEEKIANFLLSEARTQRTKDNTTIMFLDFDFRTKE